MENYFDSLKSVPKEILYSRGDPNDLRLGEFVSTQIAAYDDSSLIILGSPQDTGVKRNKGRSGAAKAPGKIREALYKFPVPHEAQGKSILDLGDIDTDDDLEEIHKIQREIITKLLKNGKRVIIIGGGNDISYPDCAALADVHENILAFNIDSHFDVRESDKPHSGTPYRQLLEGEYLNPPKFYQLANKRLTNSPQHQKYLEEKGVNIFSLDDMRKIGIEELLKSILKGKSYDAIFWGFDLDSVRSTDAPGVSAPYPLGLTADEICHLAEIAGSSEKSYIFEISEVNPDYDIDGRTSKLAAMMILYFITKIMNNI